MAVEVGRRVAGFKEEQARRVMEGHGGRRQEAAGSGKGEGFLSPYMPGVPPGDGGR
jgi:hypothetical protein